MRKFSKDKDKKPRRRPKLEPGMMRKKFCRFCVEKIKTVDYKEFKRLEKFMTDRGKILASRISGNCAKHQRRITIALKRARYVALLPFVRI